MCIEILGLLRTEISRGLRAFIPSRPKAVGNRKHNDSNTEAQCDIE
jgi:hypothetical protein